MESKSEMHLATNGALVEIGTIMHEGKEFSAQGSVIDPASGVIIGYPKGNQLTSWNGNIIEGLSLQVVSTWKTPRSWQSSTRHAYRASYQGKGYHGTGFGDGMSLVLHANRKG